MNRKLVILFFIIIFIPFATAYDLSDFPKFIEKSTVDTVVVIGDSTNNFDLQSGVFIIKSYDDCAYLNFSNTLPKSASENVGINPPGFSRCRSAATTLAIGISDLSTQNLISVGGPCANKITAQIMDVPTTWPECAEGFKNETGRIILYNNWNKTQLVVAGFSAEDTKKAANVISKYNEFNLSGYEIEVFGHINNPKLIKLTEKYNEWYKREDSNVKFNHPYVKWLIDKRGGGTFNLYITTTPDILIEGKQELRKFGNVNAFSCSESANQCYVYLQINNFDSIKDLFRIYYVEDISFLEIFSDYQLNVSLEEMKKCDKDEDCVLVSDGCCSCGFKSINKKYKDLWSTKLYCRSRICIQRVCTIYNNPKCINNQCT